MKIKIALLSIIIAFQPFLSGCWDYVEYENLAQVIALGIDYDKESHQTTVTLQYMASSNQSQNKSESSTKPSAKSNSVVHSATADTLIDALTKLQEVIVKEPFYGYCKMIVINEEAAKYDVLEILELFDRSPRLRSISHFVVTPDKAQNIIRTIDKAYALSAGVALDNLLHLAVNTGAGYTTTLSDFNEMLAISGWEPTCPCITYSARKPEEELSDIKMDNITLDAELEGQHRIGGMAAFKKDKLVGWLNEKESLGFGWILGKKIQVYKTSGTSSDVEDILYYRITKSKTSIKIQIVNNMPKINIDLKVKADLIKYYVNDGSNFITPEIIVSLQKKLSDSIKSDIEAALKKGQKELKSDIFGFGFQLFRKDPKLWNSAYKEKWDSIYPNIKVTITVNSKVVNTGTNMRKLEIN